ncbi:MAG TPA: ACP S-malonyltransferase, partial [Candidatus Limnocylindrales bacterium]|nr:ACP S-malonyltransferase [Candidatus Limnocylindrales bacterium]
NAPGQVVVSGERAAVEAAESIARELGAKRVVVLPVSVASHCPLMAEAAAGLQAVLDSPAYREAFRDPRPPLVSNVDARLLATATDCRRELVEHLTSGVDWVAAVEGMAGRGVTTFVEVGPGRVLTGLIRRIVPGREVLATDDPGAPDRLLVPFTPTVTA